MTTSSATTFGRRPPVRERGAARVVADHAAERAAVVGARVRAEAQPVRRGGRLQGREHDARLDVRRPGLRVEGQHPVEEAARVDDHPGPTALPAIDVPAPRMVSGTPGSAASATIAASSSTIAGTTTSRRDDPVVRGVGGVQRAGLEVVAHLAADRAAKARAAGPPRGGASSVATIGGSSFGSGAERPTRQDRLGRGLRSGHEDPRDLRHGSADQPTLAAYRPVHPRS